jgi:hypothetical protein
MAFGVFHLDLGRTVDLGAKGAKDVTVVTNHDKPLSSDLLLARRLGVDRQGRDEMREDAADEAGGCGKENGQPGVHESIMSRRPASFVPFRGGLLAIVMSSAAVRVEIIPVLIAKANPGLIENRFPVILETLIDQGQSTLDVEVRRASQALSAALPVAV